MSIESIQARIAEIAARRESVMQKPALFKEIFQEKLGQVSQSYAQEPAEYTQSGLNTYPVGDQILDEPVLISGVDPQISRQAQPYMDIIKSASQKYNLPVNLIMGVIKAESDFDTNSVSSAGAMGLMQLMPENTQEDGVTDAFDPAQNIRAGTSEIARFLDQYNGDLRLALAAYNTGPGNIAKRNVTSSQSPEYQTVPKIVRDYVERVLAYAGYRL